MAKPLSARIAALEDMDAAALRARWRDVYKTAPPRHASRDLLLRAVAYRIQEHAEGGLSKAALKRLAAVAELKNKGVQPPKPALPRLRPGTRLVREWRGEVHHVTVCDDGFDYRGARYASLSRIAREITGTQWSGPLFFGLRKTGRRPKGPPDGS